MNVKLLKKVKAKILLKEPRQFQMEHLFSEHLDNGQLCNVNCGTAACIAGWAMCLSAGKKPKDMQDSYVPPGALNSLLGLPFDERDDLVNKLVYDDNWPQPFRRDYRKAVRNNRLVAAAKIAAKRIDHFIENKE